jgi:formylglycine-generating enzyme required for sulfatase activity
MRNSIFRHLTILVVSAFYSFLPFENVIAQSVPQKFSYQAVVRNAANLLLDSQTVSIRINILQGSESGTAVYTETHTGNTNANGLITLEVGGGAVLSGSMSNINWANGPYFIKTETDPQGGSNYSISGSSQLLSVPYALYSGNGTPGPQGPAGPGFSNGTALNQIMYWNGTAWVTLNAGNNGQSLTICDGILTWTTGGVCPGVISALNCSNSTKIGTLTYGIAAVGVANTVPYLGVNGGNYPAQSVASTGVIGLTASLSAGTLANGTGALTFTIVGTPDTIGTASFAINIGGQSCILTRSVTVGFGPLDIEAAFIPGGTFIMGSPETEPDRENSEVQHQVTISSFRMSKYEINNQKFAAFLNAKGIGSNGIDTNGAYPTQKLIIGNSSLGVFWFAGQWRAAASKENFPIVNVTWFGAAEFATYAGGRLPTESEWEYACRAGTTTPFNTGVCLDYTQANYNWNFPYTACTNSNTNYPARALAVNSYSPNAYGLYNMHGNVWEWCSDYWGSYPTTPQIDPTGPATGVFRVFKSGSWANQGQFARSGIHRGIPPLQEANDTGFRIAFSL